MHPEGSIVLLWYRLFYFFLEFTPSEGLALVLSGVKVYGPINIFVCFSLSCCSGYSTVGVWGLFGNAIFTGLRRAATPLGHLTMHDSVSFLMVSSTVMLYNFLIKPF